MNTQNPTWSVSSAPANSVNANNANGSNGVITTTTSGSTIYVGGSSQGVIGGICTCGQNCGGTLCGYYTYPQTGGTGTTPGNGLGNGYYYQPSNIIFNTASSLGMKYSVLDLPRKDMPIAVYVCGRMVTLGILGTDVECAYVGEYLVFAPGIVNYVWNSRTTVIVDYKDETYHYNIGFNGTDMYEKESSKLSATLVSTIKK